MCGYHCWKAGVSVCVSTLLCTYVQYMAVNTVFPLKIHHSKYSSPVRNLSKYILIAAYFRLSNIRHITLIIHQIGKAFRYFVTRRRPLAKFLLEDAQVCRLSFRSQPQRVYQRVLGSRRILSNCRCPGVFVNVISSNCRVQNPTFCVNECP